MDSKESVEETQTLDVEQTAVYNLLKTFGICDSVIIQILANGYTIDTLKIVERTEVEALVQPPFLAERTKLIHGVNGWRKSLNLPALAEALTSIPTAASGSRAVAVPLPEVGRAGCTATYLLSQSPKGAAIIARYNESQLLTKSDKRVIVQIVVDGFKDRFSKLSPSELQDRAVELHELFPGEPQETWYRPAWTTDSSGRKIKHGKYAKGKLHDRNSNYKEEKVTPEQPSKQANATGSDTRGFTNDISQSDSEEYQRTKNWVIHNQDDWDEIKNKWKQTTKVRLAEWFEKAKRNTTSLLAEYSVLRNHQAYQLFQIDFQQRFPEKETLLFDRWENFVSLLYPILELEVTDAAGKSLLNLLKADDISNDGRGFITTWLLSHILPSPILRIPGKQRWKPSVIESRESVAISVKDLTELQASVASIFKVFQTRSIDLAPFIVVHGDDLKNPASFSVWNNVVAYKLPSFQKALDVCLKMYLSFDIAFPRQSTAVWSLLANLLFDIEIPPDQTNIVALCNSLRNSIKQQQQQQQQLQQQQKQQ